MAGFHASYWQECRAATLIVLYPSQKRLQGLKLLILLPKRAIMLPGLPEVSLAATMLYRLQLFGTSTGKPSGLIVFTSS